jgi:hypothetical protein
VITTTWREPLVMQMERLDRWARGRFVAEPGPGDEVVSATDYLDPIFLRAAIERVRVAAAAGIRDVDRDEAEVDVRIAVSRFTRHYACVTLAALTALANGVGLDASAARCRYVIRGNVPFIALVDDAEPLTCAERPNTWGVGGREVRSVAELRDHVWRTLYAENIAPLFDRVREITKVSRDLVWTNAAEWCTVVSGAADEYLDAESAVPYVDDRIALLDSPSLPGLAGSNPLRGQIRWDPFDAPDFPRGVELRRICCVTYMLPDRLGRLCSNCPHLPLEERVALVREQHGQPMGAPSGPAELRAIAIGRQKLGLDG